MFNISEGLNKSIENHIDISVELESKPTELTYGCGADGFSCDNSCWGHTNSSHGGM